MTTAHRPTWNSAIGSGSNPSGALFVCQTTKVANRDVANAGVLKSRKVGQGAPEERGSQKTFAEDLERREKSAKESSTALDREQVKAREERRRQAIENNPFPEDADDDAPSHSDDESGESDDDTEELQRELAKIKKEREEAEQKQKDLQQKQDERSQRDMIMKGNPVISGDLSLKRKWDDDTVFKNQARTAPKQKLRFINDAVRSDFHRKFLQKYVWVDGIAH